MSRASQARALQHAPAQQIAHGAVRVYVSAGSIERGIGLGQPLRGLAVAPDAHESGAQAPQQARARQRSRLYGSSSQPQRRLKRLDRGGVLSSRDQRRTQALVQVRVRKLRRAVSASR